ncbi:MAG: DUF1801 domain-containing protein [Parasphingorhabdus sp.]
MARNIPKQTRDAISDLPDDLKEKLFALRELILETADENPAVGALEETLKWGEPSFLTSATKSGTTIRINRHNKDDGQYAMYVHCQTDLLDRYRQLYSDTLTLDGNRAVVFSVAEEPPLEAVKHCIAMALTYHLKD